MSALSSGLSSDLSIGLRAQLHHGRQQHGVFAYPTEAVYGLGCHPWDEVALERLLAIKQRDWRKGMIVVAASLEELTPFLLPLNEELRIRVSNTWPGPVTWLLPVKPCVPELLTGGNETLAVRVSAHPMVRKVCDALGPVVSTSANPAGLPPAKTALKVRQYFGRALTCVVPGALGALSRPTQIRHGLTGEWVRQ